METVRLPYLANEVAIELGMSRVDVRDVLNTFLQIISDELAEGNEVHISPYFKFKHRISPAVKKGTMVRNPFTGTTQPSAGRPAKIGIKVLTLSGLKKAMPSATSKEGKAIISAAGK